MHLHGDEIERYRTRNLPQPTLAAIDRHISAAVTYILEEIERNGEGVASCKATTRKGKPCQRTPLPDREYCPSHQHLEERTHVTA